MLEKKQLMTLVKLMTRQAPDNDVYDISGSRV